MKVYCAKGNMVCTQLDELFEIFNYRNKDNNNYIEINDGYPFMIVLIKDSCACVMFYHDEYDAGHYVYTQGLNLNEDDFTQFFLITGMVQTETLISNKLVIPISVAWNVVKEFFINNKMLDTVNWFDL